METYGHYAELITTRWIMVLFSAFLIATLASCANPKLTHGGEKARILSPAEVANCQRRGSTTVSTRTNILSVLRQPTVIARELEILARNSATDMGGDTVSPISEIENGEQTFAVYRCIP